MKHIYRKKKFKSINQCKIRYAVTARPLSFGNLKFKMPVTNLQWLRRRNNLLNLNKLRTSRTKTSSIKENKSWEQ